MRLKLTPEHLTALEAMLDEAEHSIQDRETGVEDGLYDPDENNVLELYNHLTAAREALAILLERQS